MPENLHYVIRMKAHDILQAYIQDATDTEKISLYVFVNCFLPDINDEYFNTFLNEASKDISSSEIEGILKSPLIDSYPKFANEFYLEEGSIDMRDVYNKSSEEERLQDDLINNENWDETYFNKQRASSMLNEYNSKIVLVKSLKDSAANTFFSGNSGLIGNFSFLSANRSQRISDISYGGNELSPLGYRGEYIGNYIYLFGSNNIEAPIPSDNFSEEPKIVEDSIVNHLTSWLSYIFNKDLSVSVESYSGNTELMIDEEDELSNVGSGLTQLLPVITQLLISENKIVVLEEAEQNLHPGAQARLADMILMFSLSRRKIILETHSDHLINRLRLRKIQMKANENKNSDFMIYFATNIEEKGTVLEEMSINESGEFITDKIPEGFFDQSFIDTLAILKEIKDKN